MRFEDLSRGSVIKGILPDQLVTVIDIKWHGSQVVELTYKDANGRPGNELLYRDREPQLETVSEGKKWSFDADAAMLRLVSEAYRIRLAYLFDPFIAVQTSIVEPLPHQITAVYGEMLKQQPLRFLLADDPGAGKTIMAGLLMKELLIRGDMHRCLIVCPGNLAEQWQDELSTKFNLDFEIVTSDRIENSRTGNPFKEINLVIGRLDHLSRNEELQAKLSETDWDLIVCDEAHKMSASFFGAEVKYTKRYRLGQLLGHLTRHFLLMTATPHNGKEEDFQLFLSLLDGDRFEGRYRDGVHLTDTSDLMRRVIKENLVKFNGMPLFPERKAYTVNYQLSPAEAQLYAHVTNYVRDEFNRAEALEEGRRGNVGFALTVLQRRLASSPEAISQSLKRRRERLEARLREEELLRRGAVVEGLPVYTMDDLDDLDDLPENELEDAEEQVVDRATASQTIAELRAEIEILKTLETEALAVLRSGRDRKWEELSKLLHDNKEMFDAHGHRRKLVIFTEHRDTLKYLQERITTLLGEPDAVVIIHGSMGREERKKAEERFTQDKSTQILLATDAAGEGINLQRAHLMVNYDLPWNPNRIEQRFGRIHRIGQTEVCHLWNLVAAETREGEVFHRLCEKLEQESRALRGQIFDVLGRAFTETPLRQLLLEAIRYGDRPEVRARLNQIIDQTLDKDHLRDLIEGHALANDSMDISKVMAIREEMDRAEARRLQPHFIQSFFIEGFTKLGGTIREREPKRFEIRHVPAVISNRDRQIGNRQQVMTRYERVTFEKDLIHVPGVPLAAFLCPGHPLLDATVDLLLERYRDLLKQGAVLIDPSDPATEPRGLFYIEHTIQDARKDRTGNRRVVSKELHFVEIDKSGKSIDSGYAPYLDYRPVNDLEKTALEKALGNMTADNEKFENEVISYAIQNLVPRHFETVKQRKEDLVLRTMAAVKDRLTKEITYWDHRAEQLRLQEQAGQTPRLNSTKARERADKLQANLQRRMEELEQERQLAPLPPVIVGSAFVIPKGLLDSAMGQNTPTTQTFARDTKRVEELAMKAVMDKEKVQGFEPKDVSDQKLGWDIESRMANQGRLRFIEVKGRIETADTVTVTKNEILASLNKPEDFLLAVVLVKPENSNGDQTSEIHYIKQPFYKDLDFGVVSVNFSLDELLKRAMKV